MRISKELVYSVALADHLDSFGGAQPGTAEEARPSAAQLRRTIDAFCPVYDGMQPHQIIEAGQERGELYNAMLYPYQRDPAFLDELMIAAVRRNAFGWGQDKEPNIKH